MGSSSAHAHPSLHQNEADLHEVEAKACVQGKAGTGWKRVCVGLKEAGENEPKGLKQK